MLDESILNLFDYKDLQNDNIIKHVYYRKYL